MFMQVGEAVNIALRAMPFMHTAGAKTVAKGLGSAEHFWHSNLQSLQPGAPVAMKTLKDVLAKASFIKVREVLHSVHLPATWQNDPACIPPSGNKFAECGLKAGNTGHPGNSRARSCVRRRA